jgi:hypothetical protein
MDYGLDVQNSIQSRRAVIFRTAMSVDLISDQETFCGCKVPKYEIDYSPSADVKINLTVHVCLNGMEFL